MYNIIKNNNSYDIIRGIGLVSGLPKSALTLKLGAFGRISLEDEGDIILPEKVYSNDKLFIEHLMRSYERCSDSMGILLSGKKGLGKSFTANIICKEINLPVIKINCEISTQYDIFGFLNSIEEDHIVMIDEFEKVFSNQNSLSDGDGNLTQAAFLNYLDNGSENKVRRVFIITVNEDVSSYLLNRPSRIRYHREYDTLHPDVLKEIISDRLKFPEYSEDLIEQISLEFCNIDVLIKIIDEINMHQIPYSEFKDFFNFSNGDTETYEILDEDGSLLETRQIKMPLRPGTEIHYDREVSETYRLHKVVSKNTHGFVISIKYYNDDHDDDETQPEYIYKTLTLRKQYSIFLS